jgi:hypothetical protein
MSTAAWIFMCAGWIVILGMTAYCFKKLMSSSLDLSPEEKTAREEFHTN